MSVDETIGPTEKEDLRLVERVDRLAAGEMPRGPADREVAELLALLPCALEPLTPSAGARERLLARAGGSVPSQERKHRGGWTLPLAAAIAALLLGVSVWQYRIVERQRGTIAELTREVRLARQGAAEMPQLVDELTRRRRYLAMATSEGAEFCLLKPPGFEPLFPEARGTMVVAADRKAWYLRVHGLGPNAEGRAYKVWFHTEEGIVPGPSFRVERPQQPAEIHDGAAPESLRAISVTEESDPAVTEPRGARVLYADEAMRIL